MSYSHGFDILLDQIKQTTYEMYRKGWAERNAGNISVRLSPDQIDSSFIKCGEWRPVGVEEPELAGEYFIVTSTGSYMKNIRFEPTRFLGVVQIDPGGSQYRNVWGFSDGGKPCGEFMSHLRAHAVRKQASDGNERVVVHTHTTNLIALSYALDLDEKSLTRLLWEMHTECIGVFPMGCGYLKWMLPCSDELAVATAEIFRKRNALLWQFHGIIATGPDLDTVIGLIDTIEKAAEIYIKAASVGAVKNKLSASQLSTMVEKFGVAADPEFLK